EEKKNLTIVLLFVGVVDPFNIESICILQLKHFTPNMTSSLKIHAGSWCILGVFLLLVPAQISAAEGQERTMPTLVFKGKGEIEFSGEILERFYRCLCNKHKKLCRQGFTFRKSSKGFAVFRDHLKVYKADDDLESEDILESKEIGNSFICQPPVDFARNVYINCTRVAPSPDGFDRCKGSTYCQSFHVNLDYDTCDYNCINVHWPVSSLRRLKFGNYPKFEEEPSCKDSLDGSDSSDSSDSSDNESLVAAVAVGWLLFIILLGLVIAYIIYRFRKSRNKPSSKDSVHCGTRSNTYTGHPTVTPEERVKRKVEIKHPLPAAAEGTNDYDYYSAYGKETTDYNIIDEERVKATPHKGLKLEDIKAKLKQRLLPGTVPPKTMVAKGASSTSDGYSMAKQQSDTAGHKQAADAKLGCMLQESRESSPKDANTDYTLLESDEYTRKPQTQDAINGYTILEDGGNSKTWRDQTATNGYAILEGGQYCRDKQVTVDQLGTYNQASGSLPNEERSGVSNEDLNISDYDKVQNGRPRLAADPKMTDPDTYNTGSMPFEERDKTGSRDRKKSMPSPYDAPRR
ncbi:hypothetical protein ElyMa_000605500, partial [Elysia marginata]